MGVGQPARRHHQMGAKGRHAHRAVVGVAVAGGDAVEIDVPTNRVPTGLLKVRPREVLGVAMTPLRDRHRAPARARSGEPSPARPQAGQHPPIDRRLAPERLQPTSPTRRPLDPTTAMLVRRRSVLREAVDAGVDAVVADAAAEGKPLAPPRSSRRRGQTSQRSQARGRPRRRKSNSRLACVPSGSGWSVLAGPDRDVGMMRSP